MKTFLLLLLFTGCGKGSISLVDCSQPGQACREASTFGPDKAAAPEAPYYDVGAADDAGKSNHFGAAGVPEGNTYIYVKSCESNAYASIYQDAELTTALPNPVLIWRGQFSFYSVGCIKVSSNNEPPPATHHPSLPTPKGDKVKRRKPKDENLSGYRLYGPQSMYPIVEGNLFEQHLPKGYAETLWFPDGHYECPENQICLAPPEAEIASHRPRQQLLTASDEAPKGLCRLSASGCDEPMGVWVWPMRCVSGGNTLASMDCAPHFVPYPTLHGKTLMEYPPDYKSLKGDQ